MRFDELHDDFDDDEWAAALVRAAEAAEEDEWEWRIAMARARVEREEPPVAKLAPPPPVPASNRLSPPPSARKGAPKPLPIPAPPPPAQTFEPLPLVARRRRAVSTEAPPSRPRAATGPVVRAISPRVSPAPIGYPPVVIPPKEPRRLASGTGAVEVEVHEESGELLREAFAAYAGDRL